MSARKQGRWSKAAVDAAIEALGGPALAIVRLAGNSAFARAFKRDAEKQRSDMRRALNAAERVRTREARGKVRAKP